MTIKVALAGAGAFGIKHLDAIKLIDDVEVVSLVDREQGKTQDVARQYGIGHVATDLADSLAIKAVDVRFTAEGTTFIKIALGAGAEVPVEEPVEEPIEEPAVG